MNAVTVGILEVLCYAAMSVCLLFVLAKAVWTIGLPYAVLLEHRAGKQRGWSIAPFIEVVPLVLATILSKLVSAGGLFAASFLAWYGGGLILATYAHAFLVLFAYAALRAFVIRCKRN